MEAPMGPRLMARLFAGRLHYAWVVVAVMFVVILASVGVRATPGVLIVPLQQAFGWNAAVISGAVSLNILLFGLVGPFAAGLIQTIGLKRTVLFSMILLVIGAGLSSFVTQIWQLYLTWGVLVGLGSGAGMVGLATAIANRWFVHRRGLVVGLLTASNASGQLVFLPLLASLVVSHTWHIVPLVVAGVILALIPLVLLMLPESPASIGLGPFGSTEVVALPPQSGNPFVIAIAGLMRGVRSVDFWLLFITFAVCGFSTNGLVATHLIPFCMDHGIPEVSAASLLAAMGVFDLIGTTLSGYLTDRYDSRILLFWYYGLRGLSLVVLPFTHFDVVSLAIFSVFYGLDWVATVPPTVRLTADIFGRERSSVVFGWVAAFHQVGAATAAYFAGVLRTTSGTYSLAFMSAGGLCMLAAIGVLPIRRMRATVWAETIA